MKGVDGISRKECIGGANTDDQAKWSDDTQVRLHREYVHSHIEEKIIRDIVFVSTLFILRFPPDIHAVHDIVFFPIKVTEESRAISLSHRNEILNSHNFRNFKPLLLTCLFWTTCPTLTLTHYGHSHNIKKNFQTGTLTL